MKTKPGGWQAQPWYCLFSWSLSPLVFAHLLWRTVHDGGLLYLRQRLGRSVPAANNPLWIHAASVGEVNTVVPLLQAIHRRYPEKPMLVSTNTPTGKSALDSKQLAFVSSVFLPLDYPFAIKRFLRTNAIQSGIIVETEIWPMLLEYCAFPIVIVNGRLSKRTLRVTQTGKTAKKHRGLLANIYFRAVSRLHLVLARSESDANGFAQLGVSTSRIRTIGNLKFAGADKSVKTVQHSPLPRGFCLLASTHDDEEVQLARLWLEQQRNELLVIAPRHPDRRAALIAQLSTLTNKLSVRSRSDPVDQSTKIYLADTLGEMNTWFQHADAIFMGGSLVPHGGHNMIEPAQLGQSVVTGLHTGNFKDEMAAFLSSNAVLQADSAKAIIAALVELLESPSLAAKRGLQAQAVIFANNQVESRYLEALVGLLETPR